MAVRMIEDRKRGTMTKVLTQKTTPEMSYLAIGTAVRRYSSKQMFLKISQYSQENTCVGVSFR